MSPKLHALVMAALGAALVLVALLAWRPLVRHRGWPRVPTLLFLVTYGLCVRITLPDQIAPGVLGRLHACVVEGGAGCGRWVRVPGTSGSTSCCGSRRRSAGAGDPAGAAGAARHLRHLGRRRTPADPRPGARLPARGLGAQHPGGRAGRPRGWLVLRAGRRRAPAH
ncbi:hypothetical protein O1L55_22435 [Streptomyces albulus]|nr:hypothetical protein [Streptomyces noursei]